MTATEKLVKVTELLSYRYAREKAKRMFFEADKEARLTPDTDFTVYINTETGDFRIGEESTDSNEYPLITFSHNKEEWQYWNKFMRVEMLREELWWFGDEAVEKLDKFCEDFWSEHKCNEFDDRLWNAVLLNPDFEKGIKMLNKTIVSELDYDCGHYSGLLAEVENGLNRNILLEKINKPLSA